MRKVFALLLALLVLLALVSCEVEMQELPASFFVREAKATVWKEAVSSGSDTEGKTVSPDELESGTSAERFTELSMTLDPTDLAGYQILYCEFELTANTDAELTLEPVVRGGKYGGGASQGKNNYKLTAGETVTITLSIGIEIEDPSVEVGLDVIFTSTLPFRASEGDEETDQIDLVSWAAITYEISGLRFYGAQTTAV